jgi:HK97 family phage major capsid protein
MEQELLKKLEKSAENFDEKSKEISSIKKEVDGLPIQIKAVKEEVTAEVTKVADSLKVMKDEADKNQKALDKLLGQQNEMKLAANSSTMTFEQYFTDQIKVGITENEAAFKAFQSNPKKGFSFQMKTVGDMQFSANFGSASQSVSNVRPGIIPGTSRKTHLRQLFPQGTMDGSTFYYVKENGSGEGTLGPVAEGDAKAQLDFDLIEASANAEYIAGWTRISKKMLADVKGMTSFLQTRLLERLYKAEDNAILNGTGVTPQISGIIGGNNYTAYSGSSAKDVEEILGAISQMEDSLERTADGFIVRPATIYDVLKSKASGSGEYNLPSGTFVEPQTGRLSIAGVPGTGTTALTAGKFIVGDFSEGAMILMREPPVVEFFEQDGTNVRENKITVRVEERFAFPIFGNTYFIYGDLSGS